MDSIHFIRGYGFGVTHHLVGRTEQGNKERTGKATGRWRMQDWKKEKEELEAFSSPEMPFTREKGTQDSLPAALVGLAAERVT